MNIKELRLGHYVLIDNVNFGKPNLSEVTIINGTEDFISCHRKDILYDNNCLIAADYSEYKVLENEEDDKFQKFYISPSNPVYKTIPQPVPLSVDILERCGFSKVIGNNTYTITYVDYLYPSKIKMYAYITNGVTTAFRVVQGKSGGNMLNIRNLHELQNLYYDLTSQDLNINLSF